MKYILCLPLLFLGGCVQNQDTIPVPCKSCMTKIIPPFQITDKDSYRFPPMTMDAFPIVEQPVEQKPIEIPPVTPITLPEAVSQ